MTATASAFTSTISLTQPRSSEPEAATTPQRVGARAQPLRRDEDYRPLPPQLLCVPAVQTQRLLIVSAPRSCCPQEDSTPARPSLLPRRRSRNPARWGIHWPSSAGRGMRGDAHPTCHSPIGVAGENAVRAQLPDASWPFPCRRATHTGPGRWRRRRSSCPAVAPSHPLRVAARGALSPAALACPPIRQPRQGPGSDTPDLHYFEDSRSRASGSRDRPVLRIQPLAPVRYR